LNTAPVVVITTLHFLLNLKSVILHFAGKAFQGKTL
jgi:hypothetical protein